MNCQDFQNEFEERAGLSGAANLHLKDCADCEKLHRSQSHIWQMIESLPEVAAPADFNHKFRARVATLKASDFRPAWWKSLRYVVPVFAAVLVLTVVFASQNFFISNPQTKELAIVQEDEKPQMSLIEDAKADTIDANIIATNINSSSNESGSMPNIEQPTAPTITTGNRNTNKTEITKEENVESEGGVKDFGVNTAPPAILPNGFPQMENKTATSPNEMMNSGSQNIDSLLSFAGAEITMENGKRRVNSVQANSLAELSGLKSGDLIEAVKVNKTSGTVPGINIESLTVLRGSKRFVLPFRAR